MKRERRGSGGCVASWLRTRWRPSPQSKRPPRQLRNARCLYRHHGDAGRSVRNIVVVKPRASFRHPGVTPVCGRSAIVLYRTTVSCLRGREGEGVEMIRMKVGRAPRDWPKWSRDEITKRAKLLVIDDSEFPLIKSFRKDGYNASKWSDVKDLSQLETDAYDLILLDLEGVGRALSPDQGFGILRHIRETNPTQLVIAYSNQEWSLEYQPFFEEADAALPKTKTDYYEFKRTVDGLLDRRFSLDFYVERAEDELGESRGLAPKAAEKVREAILAGNATKLREYLQGRVDDKSAVATVVQITQIAVQVGQLVQWMH